MQGIFVEYGITYDDDAAEYKKRWIRKHIALIRHSGNTLIICCTNVRFYIIISPIMYNYEGRYKNGCGQDSIHNRNDGLYRVRLLLSDLLCKKDRRKQRQLPDRRKIPWPVGNGHGGGGIGWRAAGSCGTSRISLLVRPGGGHMDGNRLAHRYIP